MTSDFIKYGLPVQIQYQVLIVIYDSNYYIVFADCNIIINKMTRRINEINTKDIYWHFFTEVTTRPTSENKWTEKTDLELTE